jgi:hypothetical protein
MLVSSSGNESTWTSPRCRRRNPSALVQHLRRSFRTSASRTAVKVFAESWPLKAQLRIACAPCQQFLTKSRLALCWITAAYGYYSANCEAWCSPTSQKPDLTSVSLFGRGCSHSGLARRAQCKSPTRRFPPWNGPFPLSVETLRCAALVRNPTLNIVLVWHKRTSCIEMGRVSGPSVSYGRAVQVFSDLLLRTVLTLLVLP